MKRKPKEPELTPEQIDAMPAGRATDIEVLVRVFSFPRKKIIYLNDPKKEFPLFIPSGKPLRTHEIDLKQVPNFSGDMTAAFKIVEKLSETCWCGFGSWYEKDDRNKWWAGFEFHEDLGELRGLAETMPLAICRAALTVDYYKLPATRPADNGNGA